MNSQLDSDNHYEVLGLKANCSEFDVRKAYKKMAMEYHPDKWRSELSDADKAFKRIKEAYDVLSNKDSKQEFDKYEKLNKNYNHFVEQNQDIYDTETLDKAFSELIKGDYPSIKAKRKESCVDKEETRWENGSDTATRIRPQNSKKIISMKVDGKNQKFRVENFRSMFYLDDHWRRITKTEHIVSKMNNYESNNIDNLDSEKHNSNEDNKDENLTSKFDVNDKVNEKLYQRSAENYAEEQMWENIWKIDIMPGKKLKILTKKLKE